MKTRARATTVVPLFAGAALLLLTRVFHNAATILTLGAIVLIGFAAASAIYQDKSSRSRR